MQRVSPLPCGTLLADYVVDQHIGTGGFGTAYLCEDRYLKKKFVVKEFTPHHLVMRLPDGGLAVRQMADQCPFELQRGSYLKEAQALARFSHPHIARAVRYFEANHTAYLVMEYETGRNLRAYLRERGGSVTDQELEAIVRPLCDGLGKLHAAGLIHRDVKPDNVLIRQDGSPVLLDFGAVRPFGDAADVIFTPGYAPPEQLESRFGPQGAWTDIYALGATMYEMLEGAPPPDARLRLMRTDARVLAQRGGGRNATRIHDLVERCLALQAEERPQSMREILQLLRNDDEAMLGAILKDTSLKMVVHFMNWATPNDNLYLDELAAFAVAFPVIDLSWRIGDGIPDTEMYQRLLGASYLGTGAVEQCAQPLQEKGFSRSRAGSNKNLCVARMHDYAAAYLLDRQSENWTYALLREQIARHCLSATATAVDKDGFKELMADVVNRARGRVKREFGKYTSNVTWHLNEDGTGWIKRIRPPTDLVPS
ncbi:MAG: serine/threonine protein kinase [Ramlibacter sp.]|jgi:serine/threonine protein kinase|nr:serine/threonine protein kinase [Ramlibacter sp.]